MLNKLMGKLISPKIGLNVIRSHVESAVNHPVKKYDMQFHAQTEKVDFLVYWPDDENLEDYPTEIKVKYRFDNTHLYQYPEGAKLCNILMKLLRAEIPSGSTLDYAVVRFDENNENIESDMYITENGKKVKLSQRL